MAILASVGDVHDLFIRRLKQINSGEHTFFVARNYLEQFARSLNQK
jgi:hypothetical protein